MTKSRSHQSKLRMNARLIREKDRARASELRRLLLCGAAIVIPLLGYVWQRVEFIRNSSDIRALQESKQELQEANKQMTIERALFLSPKRIEEVARKKLGMIDPPPENVRRVKMLDGRVDPSQDAVARERLRRIRSGEVAAATVVPIPGTGDRR